MRKVFDAYLRSKEWKFVRTEVIKRAMGRCKVCGLKTRKKIVHHERYGNWGKGNLAEIFDCCLLCPDCDVKTHREMDPGIVPFFAKRRFNE